MSTRSNHGNVYFLVNKDTQRLFVMKGNKVLEQMLCSTGTGKAVYDGDGEKMFSGRTENGTYMIDEMKLSSKTPSPDDPKRRPYGPWTLCFFEDEAKALHGTDEPRKLGRRASAGCIRVSNENITKLKETYVGPGTEVLVIGSADY